MSVSNLSASYLDSTSARVTWSGGTAPYRVFVDGALTLTTADTACTLIVAAGDLIEVRDATESDPVSRPARARIYWRSVVGAEQYRVYEYVDSAWTLRATVTDDGRGHFNWTSRRLEDATTHNFKVTALDSIGNESTGDAISLYLVRVPDPPEPDQAGTLGGGETMTDGSGNTLVDGSGNDLVSIHYQRITFSD